MFPRQDRDTGVYSRSGISGTATTGSVKEPIYVVAKSGVTLTARAIDAELPHER